MADPTYTIRQYTIHAVARCHDCNWANDDYKKARKLAISHAIETGHSIELSEAALLNRATVDEVFGLTPTLTDGEVE